MLIESLKIVEKIEFEKSEWDFFENGIIRIKIKDNVFMELHDSIKEHNYIKKRTDYLPLKLLIIPGINSSISKEVRDYANRPESLSIVESQALVVKSLAHKVIAKFMINFYKTPIKIKIFSNEQEALNWLLADK